MKFYFLVMSIVASHIGLAQLLNDTSSSLDSQTIYRTAEQQYDSYEKEHGRFIQTPNAEIHYLTWGNSSATPLLWSHGSFSNGYELLGVVNDLVKAGYYVIAIDYYGHGKSSLPEQEVSLYHVADDIKYLMDHLNIDQAVIGGWSRGGYISTAFYDAYPESTLGLVLEDGGSVATNHHYHTLHPDSLITLIHSFGVEQFVAADTAFSTKQDAFFSIYDTNEGGAQFQLLAWIKQVRKNRWAVNPGLFKLFHHSSSEQILDNILRPTSVPLFAASMSMIEPKIIFRNLTVPVLILDPVSKNDLFPFEVENQKLQQQHPKLIHYSVYHDTDHNIHAQQPNKWLEDLSHFLGKIKEYHDIKSTK